MTDLSRFNRAIFNYQAGIDGKQNVVPVVGHDWVFQHGRSAEAILGSLKPANAGNHHITADDAAPFPSAGTDRPVRRP